MGSSDTRTSRTLSDAQLEALLDRLDAVEARRDAGRSRRNAERVPFRRQSIPLWVTHPGGSTMRATVATRNLSARGISILHWGFLHSGTHCRLVLPRRAGGTEKVEGVVAWCQHVTGAHHLVGVRFLHPIFPRQFVDPVHGEGAATDHKVDPQSISGRLLTIDEQEMDRNLLRHHLRESNLAITEASTLDEATRLVPQTQFDIVLSELSVACGADKVVQDLRAAGYAGPIVAVTAESAPALLSAAEQAGVGSILQKPYDPQQLLAVIAEWLGGATGGDDAIHSEVENQPGMAAMLEQYIARVRTLAMEIHAAADADNFDLVRRNCQTIKGSGAGYGFPLLTQAARDAVSALDASNSVAEARAELQQLEALCRRLVCARKSA